MNVPPYPSIPKLAAMIAESPAIATDITNRTIDAIVACRDRAVFTSVTPERASHEAAATSARIAEGQPLRLLDGVPVAWKDLFNLQGEALTSPSSGAE